MADTIDGLFVDASRTPEPIVIGPQEATMALTQDPVITPRTQDIIPTSARTVTRSMSRTTLQPSVHDFNGNIIKKAIDEDQVVWLTGKNHSKQGLSTDFAYPLPTAFRRGGAFNPIYLEPSRLPFVSNSYKVDRITAWTEEVHRRHVAKTARVRQRLSSKPLLAERMASTPASTISGTHESECSFSLSLPDTTDNLDDVRLTNLSRVSWRNDSNTVTSRSRPATTGRYFNSSNGLRNIRPSPAVFRSRPNTANPGSGPGLKIKKMTLHQKELLT